jgi:hypothetical protein
MIVRILPLLMLAACLPVHHVQAQSCDCITISAATPSRNNHASEIRIKIKNGCNRRIWVYSQYFWITQAQGNKAIETGKMYKLHNDAPEAILMKWQDTQELVFPANIPDVNNENISLSYSNTSKRHVRNMFGYPTYNCEKTIVPGK